MHLWIILNNFPIISSTNKKKDIIRSKTELQNLLADWTQF
jgi:hypothetical protein